ncbi:unnamed protein product [Effrenium voratum]|nr:unnamed protein product [Effrenium voratum]
MFHPHATDCSEMACSLWDGSGPQALLGRMMCKNSQAPSALMLGMLHMLRPLHVLPRPSLKYSFVRCSMRGPCAIVLRSAESVRSWLPSCQAPPHQVWKLPINLRVMPALLRVMPALIAAALGWSGDDSDDLNATSDESSNDTAAAFQINWTLPVVSSCPAKLQPEEDGQASPEWVGDALNPGPASLDDRSQAQAEWWAHTAPERQRFARLGPSGPPTEPSRRLAASLSQSLGCRICQQLLNSLWEGLARPSPTNLRALLSEGCPSMVKERLLQQGWSAASGRKCDGAGTPAVDGEPWCFLQDPLSEVIERPELAEEYDAATDALVRACEDTLALHSERVIIYLTQYTEEAPPQARNEQLMRSACTEAACCAR